MKNINFSIRNREYDFKFNLLPIMQIIGDTSTGKSLFFSDFKDIRGVDKRFENSLLINFENDNMIDLITYPCKYDFVIIDNADIILNENVCKIISENIRKNNKTYWIIIGRNYYPCVLSVGCKGNLKMKSIGNKFKFQIDYGKTNIG